jgi:hypothetical protein
MIAPTAVHVLIHARSTLSILLTASTQLMPTPASTAVPVLTLAL